MLIKDLFEEDGKKARTFKVPANTFAAKKPVEVSKGRDRDDPDWDWKNPNDNPSGEKPVQEKPHKYSGKATDYPILDGEHKTRLFDPELVAHLKSEYGAKIWNKMSELEQIKAQIDFVGDVRHPSFGGDGQSFADHVNVLAKELQAKIVRKK